jgi:hypothetical protein
VEELAWLRRMVDRGIERLETEEPDSPMRRLERSHLRRVLAVAALKEMRQLRREIETGAGPTE